MTRIAVLLLFLGARRGARRGADQTGSDFSARQRVQLIQISLGTRKSGGSNFGAYPLSFFALQSIQFGPLYCLHQETPIFRFAEVRHGPPKCTSNLERDFGARFG